MRLYYIQKVNGEVLIHFSVLISIFLNMIISILFLLNLYMLTNNTIIYR